MPFSIRPFRRFPVQCVVMYHAGLWLLIAVLLLSVGPVYAEWVEVARNVEAGMNLYVDLDTIRRNGEVVKLWALMDFYTMQTESSPPYLSVKSQREFDCPEERVRLLALTAFSGNMGSGKVVFSYSDSNDLGIAVEPGSVAQILRKVACSM